MFPTRIAEAVDVFEEGDFGLATGVPVSAPDQFCLQRFAKQICREGAELS